MNLIKTLFFLSLCFIVRFGFSQESKDTIQYVANSGDTVISSKVTADSTILSKRQTFAPGDSTLLIRRTSNLSALETTGKEIDTSAVIYGWTLDKNFILPEKFEIDTDLVGFHLDNSLIRKYSSVSFLGNVGSAYIPNYFFDRDFTEDLLFLNSYKHYFSTYNNTYYINTRKPFTHLLYNNAGSKRDKYESLQLSHSQNVSKKFNFGFDLKILSDRGQYKYLDVKNKSFKLYSSYSGEIYKFHATANLNRYQASENGGMLVSSFLDTNQTYTKSYPVNFTGIDDKTPYTAHVTNKIRYIDAMVSQQIKLFTIGKRNSDSTAKSSIAEPILSHVIIARRSSKLYEEMPENNPFAPIYSKTYVNPYQTNDSIAETRVINKLQLDFKTKIRKKVTIGVYANINHDYLKYSYYSLLDSTLIDESEDAAVVKYDSITNTFFYRRSNDTLRFNIYRDRSNNIVYSIDSRHNLSNIYVSGGIYGKFWTYFQSQFAATIYLAGYKAGETHLEGLMQSQLKIFSKPYRLSINGSVENLSPSYQLNNYYSNNYIWQQDFDNTTRVNLSSKIAAPSNKFELSGNYTLLSKYIYLTDSFPMVYDQAFNLFSLSLEKDFKVWKFHSFNKFIYQVSENEEIVDVPKLILYNSTYIDHTWKFKMTKGELRTMIGFDVHYNSYFKGYEYIPAMGMFYQNNANATEIGGYPYIDFWLNVKLKRTRFFAKYEHANSSWDRRDYFNAISYPAKQKVFKFGVSWTFYD